MALVPRNWFAVWLLLKDMQPDPTIVRGQFVHSGYVGVIYKPDNIEGRSVRTLALSLLCCGSARRQNCSGKPLCK